MNFQFSNAAKVGERAYNSMLNSLLLLPYFKIWKLKGLHRKKTLLNAGKRCSKYALSLV